MAFCPKCEAEFRPEMSLCPDCNVQLVDALSGEEREIEELAVVVTMTQEPDAYILRGFLENEGIPCVLENVSFHASPAPAGELTKVRLWAKKTDVAKARALIQEHEDYPTCSSCHHVVLAQDTTCDFCGEPLDAP